MEWWAYLLLALIGLFVVRWIALMRSFKRQQPAAEALAEAMPMMEQARMLIESLEDDPDIILDNRDAVLQGVEEMRTTLLQFAQRPAIDASAMVYFRYFGDVIDLLHEFYRSAPFDLSDPGDARTWERLHDQLAALDARGAEIIKQNPAPSFWQSLVFGVPKVRDVG